MSEGRESKLSESLDRWATDGGRVVEPRPELDDGEVAPQPRGLPPGYQAQPAWGFRDPTGHYEFSRVYGPARSRPGGLSVAVGQLDKGLSHWSVTRPEGGRRTLVTYAQARTQLGRHLTFERFSSPLETEEIRRLLNGG